MNNFENEQVRSAMPEFPVEIPNDSEIERQAIAFSMNRQILYGRTKEFGLDPDTLERQAEIVRVGAFVYPTPIPTTFAGDPENFRAAINLANKFSKALATNGYKTEASSTLTLAISNPAQNNEDCLVVPKNSTSNQKIKLIRGLDQKRAYGFALIDTSDSEQRINTFKSSFGQFKDRSPIMKDLGKAKGREVLAAVLTDFESTWKDSGYAKYLNLAADYNTLIAKRCTPELPFQSVPIDTSVYSPFLKEIKDIEVFANRLLEAGIIKIDGNFIKSVNSMGQTITFTLDSIIPSDVVLRSSEYGTKVRFSTLVESDADLAPCKEISYVLCFANLVPVIYGSVNRPPYYEPYALARTQVESLGFEPVFYRVQPVNSGDVIQNPTLFDFYAKAMFKEYYE